MSLNFNKTKPISQKTIFVVGRSSYRILRKKVLLIFLLTFSKLNKEEYCLQKKGEWI